MVSADKVPFRPSNQRGHPDDEQPAQIFVAHLRDPPQPLLAAARVLQRRQTQPSGELSSGAELVGVGDRSSERRGTDHADTWNCRQPPGNVVRTVPDEHLTLDLTQPRLEIEYLPGQARDHLCCQRRYVRHIVRSGPLGDHQRLPDPLPDLYAELRQQATDHVDQLCALLDEQVACPVHPQRRLLLRGLDRERIVGRRTASQIASASLASVFPRLT